MENVLEVKNLTKLYPPEKAGKEAFLAVDKLSFNLKKGEILGLLGPNGAGKTTTIQMLLGLTTPTSGSIRYFGRDFATNREYALSRLNFASAYGELQGKMTVIQNLTIYGSLYAVKDIDTVVDRLLDTLEISHLKHSIFWKLSSGQQTRVILAKALINDPQLLLMDEPTASLDPDIVSKIIDLIRRLQEEQKVAILYTSHNMEEITRLCDRVMFLHAGRLVAKDTPLGLTKLVGNAQLILTFDGDQKKITSYLEKEDLGFTFVRSRIVEIDLPETKIPGVLFGLKKEAIWVTDIDIKKPTLEDVFLSFARKAAP